MSRLDTCQTLTGVKFSISETKKLKFDAYSYAAFITRLKPLSKPIFLLFQFQFSSKLQFPFITQLMLQFPFQFQDKAAIFLSIQFKFGSNCVYISCLVCLMATLAMSLIQGSFTLLPIQHSSSNFVTLVSSFFIFTHYHSWSDFYSSFFFIKFLLKSRVKSLQTLLFPPSHIISH